MKIVTHRVNGDTTITRGPRQYGDWTKERIALLKSLWKTSAPSSEIAEKINALPGAPLTKNACCGKASRLGLNSKPSATTSPQSFDFRSKFARRGAEKRWHGEK